VTLDAQRVAARLVTAVYLVRGWPKVISNLKSLLKTGATAMPDPYPTAVSRSHPIERTCPGTVARRVEWTPLFPPVAF
jgi:hypothetical protein